MNHRAVASVALLVLFAIAVGLDPGGLGGHAGYGQGNLFPEGIASRVFDVFHNFLSQQVGLELASVVSSNVSGLKSGFIRSVLLVVLTFLPAHRQ